MIFVTVGTQLPFDRLVAAVDDWAENHRDEAVIAQIGDCNRPPRNLDWVQSIDQIQFRKLMHDANLIVSHAGMGTIFMAMELKKPLIVMPRRADLGEHRNEHQLATARHLSELDLITVAEDACEMVRLLDNREDLLPACPLHKTDSGDLHHFVRDFVAGGQYAA